MFCVISFLYVPFSAACGFGVAFGLHIGSGGGDGGVVCGLPLRLEDQFVNKIKKRTFQGTATTSGSY
jgi:hypothetical protein